MSAGTIRLSDHDSESGGQCPVLSPETIQAYVERTKTALQNPPPMRHASEKQVVICGGQEPPLMPTEQPRIDSSQNPINPKYPLSTM